jgi:hypothetical protein
MKIIPKEIGEVQAVEKTKNKQPVSDSFQRILQSEREKAVLRESVALPPSPALPDLSMVYSGNPGEKSLVLEAESMLDLLEDYQKQMENPLLTLKDVYPLVERMERETERLSPVLESLPEGSAIKDILNRILVASSVEVIKFNRGDYL